MASTQPIFDVVLSGSGTVNSGVWVDLGAIPSGKQLLLGYATYAAEDKACKFSLRSNKQGKSSGSVSDTDLLDCTSAMSGTSVDRDMYYGGAINTLTTISTGVEHLWLYVDGHSSSSGGFDYIIRYTTQ